MNHSILPGVLAISLLVGCQSFPPTSPPQHQASPDRYGAASSVAITRHKQYQMWDKGIFSSTASSQSAAHIIRANSDAVSFDWEGDAVELLAELARVRGLQFNYSGVRLPLPVTLHVREMTFANVLRLLESQTAWRASLQQYPGLLQLSFMQQGSSRK
ncbi:DotD/TraH family lipoprotein [Pectobacterium aroidearum]|uniref:DotD/TraH family lipoprotein n=1 Tax=Pectobacterium aroidearum TaxID=1201031 RepID=UPI0031582835